MQGARRFYYDVCYKAWDRIVKGDALSVEEVNELRLAATNAAHTSAQAIQLLYRICGMAAAANANRMQQLLRDVMVVTQHAALSEAIYEQAGGILAGLPTAPGYP